MPTSHPLVANVPDSPSSAGSSILKKLEMQPRRKEVVAFIRNLGVLTDAHIPVADALASLANSSTRGRLTPIISAVGQDVNNGRNLADGLGAFPKVFPTHYVELTRVGEATGQLSEILLRLAEQEERLLKLKQQIRSALAYPALVMTVTIVCTTFLLTAIVPRFEDLYSGFGADLPAPTAFVVALSGSLMSNWPLWMLTGLAIALILRKVHGTKSGKSLLHGTLLRLPVLGRVMTAALVGNFSRTLSLLIRSGVPVDTGITLATNCASNARFKAALIGTSQRIADGTSVTDTLRETQLFPGFAIDMMAAGEAAGELATSLEHVGSHYASEVETASESMAAMVEPVLIIVVGSILGGLLAALYLPLFDIVNVVQ